MSNIDKRELRHSAESIIVIMEGIAGFEPSDIDGDSVELRFETEDGFDTGCDVSIVDQCQKASDVVLALLDELEAKDKQIDYLKAIAAHSNAGWKEAHEQEARAESAEKRIAELEAREVVPDEMTPKQASRSYCGEVRGYRDGWNDCRAKVIGNMLLVDMDRTETDNTNQQFESLSRGDK